MLNPPKEKGRQTAALSQMQNHNISASVMLQAIKLAAQYNIPVFPCGKNKHPTCPHGFKDASKNPDDIREL